MEAMLFLGRSASKGEAVAALPRLSGSPSEASPCDTKAFLAGPGHARPARDRVAFVFIIPYYRASGGNGMLGRTDRHRENGCFPLGSKGKRQGSLLQRLLLLILYSCTKQNFYKNKMFVCYRWNNGLVRAKDRLHCT